MKNLATKVLALALLLLGGVPIAIPQNKNNPKNDPDVQKGYDTHQAQHKSNSQYEVKTSHGEYHPPVTYIPPAAANTGSSNNKAFSAKKNASNTNKK